MTWKNNYKGGQTYEVGKLELKDNESVFIEGGAVVKGCIHAKDAKDISFK